VNDVMLLLIIIDIGLTLINICVLGLGVKLYTDQKKQNILGDINRKDERRLR